jgi:lipopolysaccharide transport system ATP-binding protein
MPSDVIIAVESLGKKYSIRHQSGERYTTLRDTLAGKAKSLFRHSNNLVSDNGSPAPMAREDFWALKSVSFEVKRGEVVGIIGRNGAGKSTLLKILSRITEPTEGRVRIKGRVASLLEVGTGFHPELTGRENIFLNGAVLGMTRVEIRKKFDEIVAFAETEKFLDTPVKRYSSGMYVRLAFAVAAHLEPEILVIDEVLAVGDTDFQKKCLGKMRSVAKDMSRTVLFVSHNMPAVQQVCTRGILLSAGEVTASGDLTKVIQTYLSPLEQINAADFSFGAKSAIVERVQFVCEGRPTKTLPMGGAVRIEIACRKTSRHSGLQLGLTFNDAFGGRVLSLSTNFYAPQLLDRAFAKGKLSCVVPRLPLTPNVYSVSLIISDAIKAIERHDDFARIEICEADVFGTGKIPRAQHGPCFCEAEWILEDLGASSGSALNPNVKATIN